MTDDLKLELMKELAKSGASIGQLIIENSGTITYNDHRGRHEGAAKPKPKEKKAQPLTDKPPVSMTFKRRGQVSDGHLTLIFMKLLKENWIAGNEADFKALFSGTMDDDCILTWKGAFGKSTLVELFRQFVKTGLIMVPDGFTIPSILEAHFIDENGERLTGLGKGDKANDKGLPLIAWCSKMLKTDPQRLLTGGMDEAFEYGTAYDPYDHQDLQYHTH